MRAKLLYTALASLSLGLAHAQYNPIPLTPGSFTQDIVVEKAAPCVGNLTTVTIDHGTNNYGYAFFEQGLIPSMKQLGLPPHGTTFASLVANHSYQMPPSYVTNNCAFVGADTILGTSTLTTQVASASLKVNDPATTYRAISFLYAGAYSGLVNFTISYADGASESSSFTSVDWTDVNTAAAWIAGGRIAPDGGGTLNSIRTTTSTKLFNLDYTLTHSGAAITNISLAYGGTTGYRVFVFGVSATTDGTTFNPVSAVSGFNADAVVEMGAPQPFVQGCDVTFDGGPQNSGDTYYEQGFCTVKGGSSQVNVGTSQGGTGTTGLPHPGTVLPSSIGTFQMPASYAGNCAVYLANYAAGAFSNGMYASPSYLSATVTLTSPQAYGGLAFLGTAGGANTVIDYTVHYANSTTQTGSFTVGDWFGGAGTPVFIAKGRVNPWGPSIDNLNQADAGKLFSIPFTLTTTSSAVTSIDLSWVSGGRAGLFALSAQPVAGGSYAPISFTGFNADPIIEKEQPFYPAGMFPYTTATMDQGTNNSANTWYERGWVTNGALTLTGLPAAGSTFASLVSPTRLFVMPPSYTGPNAVLIDTNHQVANLTPVTPTAGSGFALLTAGAAIGSGTMTNLCILMHANGFNETNAFYGYDWFNTSIAPAFISNGRVDSRWGNLTSFYNNPQQPRLFETIFPTIETTSPVTNVMVQYKLAGGSSWTTYVLGVSATTAAIAPVVGPTILNPSATYDGSNVTAQATESGTLPITNQWQFSTDGVTWVNLANGVGNYLNASSVAGAWSTVVLTNTSIGFSNNGQFRLVASNSAGSTTNGAATLRVVSALPDVTSYSDTNSITLFMPGGEPVAEPAAETYIHVIDNLVGTAPGKWLCFGPGGNTTPWNPYGYAVGFTVTPAIGKTTVSALRYYTANDAQERDPGDYTLEGSNDGGTTWTTIAQGLLNMPAGRNGAASGALNPLTQNLQEVRFANNNGYLMYRWSCTNVHNNAAASIMQIGDIEFLGTQTPAAPTILSQTGPQVKTYIGAAPTFFVQAQGFPTNLAYQWYRDNGTGLGAIAGATSSSYTLANAQLGDSGAVFRCTVTNSTGSATSINSTLTIIPAPTTAYATNVMGDQPIAYLRLDEGPDDGSFGGNNGVTAYDTWGGHNGYYTNTILQQAGFSALDADKAAYFGMSFGGYLPTTGETDSGVEAIGGIDFAKTNASAAFSIEAWVMLDPNLVAGGPVPGAGILSKGYGGGGEQFNLDLGGTGNAFRFFVRDTSGGTHGAPGTVVPEPGVWHHVVGVVDEAKSNVLLYVDGLLNASGAVNPTNGILSSSRPMLIGSRPSNSATNNNLLFYGSIDEVAVYNYALSSNQVLNHFYAAGEAPRFTAQPTNTTFSEGTTARFYAAYYGSPTLQAQWYQSADGGGTWSPVAGQTTATLTLANVPASSNGYQYYLQVNNTYGTTNSSVATLTVQSGPPSLLVDITPSQVLAYAGRQFSLQAVFGGTPPITYQWYRNGVALANNSRISGAQSNVLTIVNALTNDTGSYQVFAQNSLSGGNPTPSSPATVAVETMPDFNTTGLGWSVNQNGGPTRNIANNLLTLTDNNGNEATSAFYQYPLYIGAFQAGFIYQDVSGPNGADGAAFVLQNDPRGAAALGGGGGGLGLLGITPSFALTLNIYANASGGKGMSFGLNGDQGLPYTSTDPVGLDYGDPVNVSLLYQGGLLSVTMTAPLAGTTFRTNVLVDLPAILTADTAYVGFTGADGGIASMQTITNFYFIPQPMLTAKSTSTNTVVLSWPASVGGYALLEETGVAAKAWAPSPATVNLVGTQFQAVVSPTGGSKFYRLVLQPGQ